MALNKSALLKDFLKLYIQIFTVNPKVSVEFPFIFRFKSFFKMV